MKSMLELVDVHRTYLIGESTVHALRGVSLTIEQGEFVAIMGASGSGKSSLLQILGLLDNPDKGEYRIFGNNVNTMTEDEQAGVRNNVAGFVFQQFHLLKRMSIVENVRLPHIYSVFSALEQLFPDRDCDLAASRVFDGPIFSSHQRHSRRNHGGGPGGWRD